MNRIERLQKTLEQEGIDGALYAPSANLQYLLGDPTFWWQRTPETGGLSFFGPGGNGHFLNKSDCVLYIPNDDTPVLITSYERAKDLKPHGIKHEVCFYVRIGEVLRNYLSGKKIACGESCNDYLKQMLTAIDAQIETVDGEGYVEKMRVIKDPDEISTLRKAAKLTDEAMQWLIPHLKPGKTPADVQNLLSDFALNNGLKDVPFPPTCHCTLTGAPGSERLDGFAYNKPIETGTALAFDFGYIVDGYSSDYGRSFYCGPSDTSISDAYKALQEAQVHLLSTIKPGVKLDTTYKTLHKIMEKYGIGKYLRNYGDIGLMGHQIGIDVHERPWLHDKSEEIYRPGMIMCIEPKFWKPGTAYLRVEDMVLITEHGCESLTTFDRELFELPV